MANKKPHTSAAVINRYRKKTYDVIRADIRKDLAQDFRAKLAENGDTVAGVLREAITAYTYGKDGGKTAEEEKQMKHFFIIDETPGDFESKKIEAKTPGDASKIFQTAWAKLSAYDQERRTVFELVLAEEDEFGDADLNTAELIERACRRSKP